MTTLYADDPDVSVDREISDADGGPLDFEPVVVSRTTTLEAAWVGAVATAAGVSKRRLRVSLFLDDGSGGNQLAAGTSYPMRLVVDGAGDVDLGSEYLS